MVAPQRDDRSKPTDIIESLNPATSEILGTVPVMTEEQVSAAVSRARFAADAWGKLARSQRRHVLLGFRRALAARAEELADLIHRENGKPRADAMNEVLLSLIHLSHAISRMEPALRTRRVSTGLMPNFRAEVSYHPLGVVGVIGPWNFPLFTPIGSIASALAAGNAVVFKPSELTPLCGQLLGEIARDTLPIAHLFQVVTGDGRTGAALAGADVDKIAFTGSSATGTRVLQAAAPRLTPVVLELGGKDAMIVTASANLEHAAQAAVFGALSNAGQACTSIERCYVVGPVYQEFVSRVAKEARKVRWGQTDADYGPITRPEQVDVIRRHLADASAKGASALVGGEEHIRGTQVPPTVLVDVTPDMLIMREETFGPVLPILRVESAEEAMEQANALRYGLGAAVFGDRAREVAGRIRAGMVSVNSVLAFAAIPSLPFGGVGQSGFGRIHGDEGLREFSRVQSTAEKRFDLPVNMLSFGASEAQLKTMITQLFGGGAVDRVGQFVRNVFR